MSADRVLGLTWTGHMSEPRLAGLIRTLPPGCTEIYTHPAVSASFEGAAKGYAYAAELAALVSQRCREALRESGAAIGGYVDMLDAA
jgi:chitin disaccharide deacetylase